MHIIANRQFTSEQAQLSFFSAEFRKKYVQINILAYMKTTTKVNICDVIK
jgi:hypothetical protein